MTTSQKIRSTRDMLDGALNRMTVTDDPAELKTLSDAVLSYINEIKTLNETRIKELIEFRITHPEYKHYA